MGWRRMGWSALAALTLSARGTAAAETQFWTTNSAADYAAGESHGVVVHPDGTLVPGPAAASAPDDSLTTIWAVAVLRDGSVALAGDHGRIDRWTRGGGVRPWVRLGAGQVLSLAADGDGVIAGTGPRGLVYRVGARGDTALLARTGERYVWGLAPAGAGGWWAATGTLGRLVRISARGEVRTALDTDESNLVSIAADGHGGAFVGGDSKGRVYHAHAGGGATTVFDAGEDEVRALAVAPDGAVWAAGLSVSATSADQGSDDESRPAPVKAPAAGGRATLYRLAPDSAAVAWWSSPQPLVYALAMTPQGPVAATGNRAGLFAIEGPMRASQLLAPPQGQITALVTGPDGALLAATSNPAALWRVGPGPASEGTLDAPAQDARQFARFGRLAWTGEGRPRFETRSGNAEPPDTTWSRWQALGAGDRVASPAARYLQWRVTLSPGTRVDEVSIAWREQNLAPRIDDLSVAAQGQSLREGELSARSEAVTQTLPSGQRVEYSVNLPSAKAIREVPVWARGLRTLQWHASDPNGDPLRFRVLVRAEPAGPWIEIGKDLEASSYTWNTNTLPDGRYRVRVIASDAPGNAIGEETTAEAVSEPFTVDNTPPEIASLTAQPEPGAARIEGAASDAQGPVVRLEAAVDDGPWRSLAPDGGIADAARVTFHARLPDLAAGEHLVSVRALDAAGNAATRAVRVTVARAR